MGELLRAGAGGAVEATVLEIEVGDGDAEVVVEDVGGVAPEEEVDGVAVGEAP